MNQLEIFDSPSVSAIDLLLSPAQHDALSAYSTVTVPINQAWFQDKLRAMKISQRQLAKKIGLDPAAVSYMFQGKRNMSMDEAKRIAEILLLPVTEVMRQAGIDVVDDVRKVPIAGYIAGSCDVSLLPKGTHDLVIAPADVPSGSFALQHREVNSPFDGWIVFISGVQESAQDTVNKLCMVAVNDGRLLLSMVRRGYKAGLFNLVNTQDHGVLENQHVAWTARVLWIQPT